jgi:prepilin-type N-terminal cleavage/methylation domain-containing protein
MNRTGSGNIRHAGRAQPRRTSPGFSLMEVMIVMTIMGVLIAMAAPTFQLALEQSRADVAGANLRAIWSAERIYWLENHTFSTSLSELNGLGLVDPAIVTANTFYSYAITGADATTFTATATRGGSSRWLGAFSIDQTGTCTGSVDASGEASIQPGYQ